MEELKKKLHDNRCENKEKVVSKVERTTIESGVDFLSLIFTALNHG